MKTKLFGFVALLLSGAMAIYLDKDLTNSYSSILAFGISISLITMTINIFFIWLPRASEKNRYTFFSILILAGFILLTLYFYKLFK